MPTVQEAAPIIVTHPPQAASRRPVHSGGGSRFLNRQCILDATEACFAESGYDGATIRAIAERLGCAVGSMYRHFTDKHQLLLAAAERLMQPVLDDLAAGTGFEQSARAYIEAATRRGELYRLQFWLATSGPNRDELHRGAVPPSINQIIDGWADLIGGRAEAEQRWAMIHGLLMLGHGESEILMQIQVRASPKRPDGVRQAAWQTNADEDMTLL